MVRFIQGPAKRTEWDGKAVLLYAASDDKMYWLGRLLHSGHPVHLRRDLLRQTKEKDSFNRKRPCYILRDAHDKPKELEDRVLIPYVHTCNEIVEALRKDESLEVLDLRKATEEDDGTVLFLTPVGLTDAKRKVLLLQKSQVCHSGSSSVVDVAKAAWEGRIQDCRKRGEEPASWECQWQVTTEMKKRWSDSRELLGCKSKESKTFQTFERLCLCCLRQLLRGRWLSSKDMGSFLEGVGDDMSSICGRRTCWIFHALS